MLKEAKARILINDLLRRSGWRFFDDETGPANIALEANVKLKKKGIEDLGDDFEKTAADYVDHLFTRSSQTLTRWLCSLIQPNVSRNTGAIDVIQYQTD